MNKRQARLFAIGSTILASVAFLGLTLDSHRQFGKLTNADKITAEVSRGKDVWHKNNCINCHTVFGEGAYYAPDLTKITKLRGNAYLTAYLRDPSKFYDETRHRRLMPKQDLSERDITDLIAFLDWVSNVDNQGWPPRPMLVTGSAFPALTQGSAAQRRAGQQRRRRAPATGAEDPIALGRTRVSQRHPGVHRVPFDRAWREHGGPVAGRPGRRAPGRCWPAATTRARRRMRPATSANRCGSPARTWCPAPMYSANGVSFMPNTYGKDLTPAQIDQLAAYLTSLK